MISSIRELPDYLLTLGCPVLLDIRYQNWEHRPTNPTYGAGWTGVLKVRLTLGGMPEFERFLKEQNISLTRWMQGSSMKTEYRSLQIYIKESDWPHIAIGERLRGHIV